MSQQIFMPEAQSQAEIGQAQGHLISGQLPMSDNSKEQSFI